ncbi:hypothetical protein TVAG_472710 [Trichomonas vaginalis G3]|uniref:Uncharacterized protein n=1 Tax=Trichomonas vaginalis (strain ATCC PRA-98 / G3) TaxID=412133 RepID=A2FU98_TRIV3|nr:WD40 repeat-like family [Trichomonas vaginalis G3]EAX91529.1 hypothetical protein TVAG_472710 [Trichomonas vaginalis G3]KAI5537943.1 WD40 repeat-like family [Trichomonas vaginalis G3]|eukprot:XP_001304459.1 hypothetical protein [Trichomonas vaginalis G3]
MNPIVKGSTPYTIGVQNNKTPLPMSFNLSCCCWLNPVGIFASNHFNIRRLAAAGTVDGQILILDVKETLIQYVSLMCGHTARVSDIIQQDLNTFLSVSIDGTICMWSIADAICLFSNQFTTQYSNYKLATSYGLPNLVYIWSNFGQVYLVDVHTGNIVKNYNFPGLLSFSPSSTINKLIVSNILSFNLYTVGELGITCDNQNRTFFDLNDVKICTPFGIVRFCERRIIFIDVVGIRTLGSMLLHNISDEDQIIDAKWYAPDQIFVAFRSGILYEFKLDAEAKVKAHKIAESKIMINFASRNSNSEVIFINNNMNLVYIAEGKGEIELVRNHNSKIFEVPDIKQPNIVRITEKNTFKLLNWTTPSVTSPGYSIDSKITAIKCRNITSHGLQLIVGAEDGTVRFFWKEKQSASQKILALNSPVVEFIELSLANAGKFILFAIGKDGSLAVFYLFDLIETFITIGFPIVAIYAMRMQELIIVRRLDNTLYVYSLNEPDPIELLTSLPKDAEQIYPVKPSTNSTIPPSTQLINFGKSSYYYSTLTLNNLQNELMKPENAEHRKLYSSMLAIYFHLLQPVSKSKSFGLIRDSISTDFTQFAADQIKDPDVDTSDFSFCLIGTNKIPTFFYPLYTISGMAIYDVSPYQAALHFVASNIIGQILSLDCSLRILEVTFVQSMVHFLESDDQKIRQIASLSCARSASCLHLEHALPIAKLFGDLKSIDSLSPTEMLLLCILCIAEDSFVNKIHHRKLFDFLLRVSVNDDDIANLALILLIDGYTTWSYILGNHLLLMNNIVARMLKFIRPEHVQRTFAIAAGSDIGTFFKVFETFIKSEETDLAPEVLVTRLFSLTTLVSFANKHAVGALGSYYIATVGNDYPRLANIAIEELKKHAKRLESVDVKGNLILIGLQDGCVSLFKHCNLIFSEKFFETPVCIVSIGPDGSAAAAASRDDQNAVIFTTKRNGFMSKKPKVIAKVPTGFHPVWKSPTECTFQ